jgi:metal-dependent amidase/aminoacylase/carboxypeptidase family protein
MPCFFCLISLPAVLMFGWCTTAQAQSSVSDLEKEIGQRASQIERELIDWRRHIHKHPELGEQETRTAGIVAHNLTELGLEVKSRVASTGIVALLRGGRPGPVVALRAELDALPVKEPAGLPFASRDKGKYLGSEFDLMHACGHDARHAYGDGERTYRLQR